MDLATMVYLASWPDVPINRNNSEQEMFEKYFDIIDKEAVTKYMTDNFDDDDEDEVKNNNEAQNFRTLGNKFYEDLNYDEALKLYNISISRASRHSIEFGLAFANRSAVLFDMEKYEECLEDINMTLKSEYPKDLQYKIYLRQSRCYLKLKLNFEVAKALRKAQECADKFNKSQISLVNNKIKEIKSQLKEELQTEASDNEPNDDIVITEPTLKDEENPKFINAAKIVDFRYTKKLGRHVVAKNEIKKGDVLFVEEPYAFTALYRTKAEVRFNICAFCLKKALHCIPCLECKTFFYCSDKCRQTGWDMSHRWECLGHRRKIINVDHQLSLSVLFQASRDGFESTVKDESVYGNKENNYPFLNKLLTHKNNVSYITLKTYIMGSVWMVLYLRTFTDYFDWLYVQPNRPEGSLDKLHRFVGGQLVKYMLQNRCNAVTIREGIVHFKPMICYGITHTAVGCGIFPSTTLLNHSCLPNAVHSFHGTKRVVKARQDIKKGIEITINYLEETTDEVKADERQLELERYCFTCSCPACTDPSFLKLRRPFLCPRCNGKAFQVQQEMFAKCSVCHFVFNAIQHFRNNNAILELHIMFDLFNDQSLLDEIYKLMKKTYHKDNVKYLHYYIFRIQHYEKKGDIKKCVDIQKLCIEIWKNVFGDTSKLYVLALMDLSYYLVKYSKTIRKKNTKNYKKLLDEIKTVIKKSAEILQYYICIANVKKYVDDITKYLNSDSDVYMKNIIIFEDCD